MKELTVVFPYYRQPIMLREQIKAWNDYPEGIRVLLVDDGSPEPAREVVLEFASSALLRRMALYRIEVDIPWNRGGARNLGAKEAVTDWIVQIDLDHVLPAQFAQQLLDFEAARGRWYRFERFRVGKADETRRKDKIGDDVEFGKIHPHIDSYLCERDLYWKAGGYNEDFSGCLGGGSPFLAELERAGGKPLLVPDPLHLLVFTRSVAADASDHTLSRDRTEFARRKAAMRGRYRGHNPIRFPWNKQDLCTRAA